MARRTPLRPVHRARVRLVGRPLVHIRRRPSPARRPAPVGTLLPPRHLGRGAGRPGCQRCRHGRRLRRGLRSSPAPWPSPAARRRSNRARPRWPVPPRLAHQRTARHSTAQGRRHRTARLLRIRVHLRRAGRGQAGPLRLRGGARTVGRDGHIHRHDRRQLGTGCARREVGRMVQPSGCRADDRHRTRWPMCRVSMEWPRSWPFSDGRPMRQTRFSRR